MPRRREVPALEGVRVMSYQVPGLGQSFPANSRLRDIMHSDLCAPDAEGIVVSGQLVELDATLEGLGIESSDPRGLAVLRLGVQEQLGVQPALIGGLLPEQYPQMVEMENTKLDNTLDSLVPDSIYPIVGGDDGVLVHGEGLHHLTFAAQDRCTSKLKSLLRSFPKGLARTKTLIDLPVKTPDFSDIIKKLKDPRHYKHAFEFMEEIKLIVLRYHHLSMCLVTQTPKDEEERLKIEAEYGRMQSMLDLLFEPGVLQRLEGGQLALEDPEVEICCRPQDRIMPGSDGKVYYVGPVRNRAKPPQHQSMKVNYDYESQWSDLVVKMQGITPSTVIGDLLMCYKLVAGSTMNLTCLKYAEEYVDMDTLVHDVIKKPVDLGLKKFYFTYAEAEAERYDIDEVLEFLGGEEEKPPLKNEGKKKKKQKKKPAKPETKNAGNDEEEVIQFFYGGASVVPESYRLNAEADRLEAEAERFNAEEYRRVADHLEEDRLEALKHMPPQVQMSEGLEDIEQSISSEVEDLSLQGAHGHSSSEELTSLQSMVQEEFDSEFDSFVSSCHADEHALTGDKMQEAIERMEKAIHVKNVRDSMLKEVNQPGVDIQQKEEVERKISVQKHKDIKERERLTRALEVTHRGAEEDRVSVQEMIDEKGKEMAKLITSVEEIEDGQAKRNKRVSQIECSIKELEDERLAIQRVCAEAAESINKIEKKRQKLGKYMDTFAAKAKEAETLKDQEAKTLKDQLKKLESSETDIGPVQTKNANSGNPELLQFIDRQIESLKRELECPVCFEIASSPIFKCEDDHLICSGCRAKVSSCPQCREPFPPGTQRRFRGAERQAEKLAGLNTERATVSGT